VQPTTPPMPPPVADRAGEWPVYILALLVGLSIGSFLNVCIHRLPAEQSLVWPGSRCPRCAAPIAWYDNVPIVSWLRLGGRCRTCHAPISMRYPVIELLTGGLALLSLARFGATPWAVVAFAFACALVVVSVIDLEHGIIPDVISLPGILVGLAVSALVPGGVGLWNAFAGAVLGGGLLWAIAAGYQRAAGIEGLGLGDVKLLAMIGAFLGWQSLPAVLLVASITGSLGGIAVIASRRGRTRARRVLRALGPGALARHLRRTPLPFGPFLALGALAALFVPSLALPWSWVASG
jgi:leader peptidase (prepilin peptidase) / N-methyltransferase